MERKLTEQLKQWKAGKNRKPLIVQGARQVGKTYCIKEFGKSQFDNLVYINFELEKTLAEDFLLDISPKSLISKIELYFGVNIQADKTLLFFDEIQSAPRALTSLKYFNENAPEFHIIAAGSLLGVAIQRENYSFPVGQVEFLTMYPLDFEEFLWAMNKKSLADQIKLHYSDLSKMELHDFALTLYKSYLICGGMPEVVKTFVEENSYIFIQNIQNSIINSYIADMAKYAKPTETTKILAAYKSIPTQLAKDNKKFQFKVVQKGGSASLFGNSIDWLCASNIVNKCQLVEKAIMPLTAYQNLSSFKLYMSDVGLLVHSSGFAAHSIISNSAIQHPFIGTITENYVANHLVFLNHSLFYWTSENSAEIDFVLQNDKGEIIPLEVKTALNVKSRSISVFNSKYNSPYTLRCSAKNFGFENNIKSIPLYACFCLTKDTI